MIRLARRYVGAHAATGPLLYVRPTPTAAYGEWVTIRAPGQPERRGQVIDAGAEVVGGWRVDRHDSWSRRAASWTVNRLTSARERILPAAIVPHRSRNDPRPRMPVSISSVIHEFS